MDPLVALIWIIALLAAATVLGFLLRRRSSSVKRGNGTELIEPTDFGLEQFGPAGAVIQFSTEFCSRCPGVQRQLTELTGEQPGIQFQHLDVTNRADLANKYQLLQTPTVLTIAPDGKLQERLSGALSRQQLSEAVHELSEGTP